VDHEIVLITLFAFIAIPIYSGFSYRSEFPKWPFLKRMSIGLPSGIFLSTYLILSTLFPFRLSNHSSFSIVVLIFSLICLMLSIVSGPLVLRFFKGIYTDHK